MADVDDKLKQMSDFRTVFISSIVSALALVVGLFWNDAFKTLIEDIVPAKEGTFYKFVAAFFVTVLVVIIIYLIMHSQKVAEKRIAELKKIRAVKLNKTE
jgi:short subunit fatty acids transporter